MDTRKKRGTRTSAVAKPLRTDQLTLVLNVIKKASCLEEPDAVFRLAVEAVAREAEAFSHVSIYSFDPKSARARRMAIAGADASGNGHDAEAPVAGALAEAVANRGVFSCPDVRGRERDLAPRGSGTRSILCLPILSRGEVAALLNIESRQPEAFPPSYTVLFEILCEHLSHLVEKMQAARDKESLQRQLMQTEKLSAIGQLISGVVHELNNPLTGVIGYAQLLASRDCDEPIKRGLEVVHTEARRCQRIVQNLLTFARKHPAAKSCVSVNDILESTLELRAYQLRMDNIQVVFDLDRDLPTTRADFHQLQQVIMNLLGNAQQAIKESGSAGTIRVGTSHRDGIIQIVLEDNGPGIAPENISRIFDPFFTTKPTGEGTGLGLSICYGIIQEHDGRIDVESAVGRGTSFTIELPVIHEQAAAAAGDQARPSPPAGHAAPSRLLVVDDEPSILDVMAEALRACGHDVDTAMNGRLALKKILRGNYDLIISDLKMPEMSGQELYREVSRERPALAERFIFATGDVMGGDTQEFLERTGKPYVEKPFHVDRLIGLLSRLLAART